MTEQTAIEKLKAKLTCKKLELLRSIEKGCDRNCDECEYCYAQGTVGEQREALAMAIQALEKQIPKKPIEPQGFPRFGYCPSCGKTVTKHSSYVGCSWCLQVLDWSEEDERD